MGRPKNAQINKFNIKLKGSFGTFQTNESYPVYFLQTVIPIKEINRLQRASEALINEDLKFEEIIQRDLDIDRVKKIAENYLEQGRNDVIFFPPLIATIVTHDDRTPLEVYDNKNTRLIPETTEVETSWGVRFRLKMPIEEHEDMEYPESVQGNEEHKPYKVANYWAELELNDTKASLIVIDGQHRLEALKHLNNKKEKKQIVEKINIPVCVVFSPNAVEDNLDQQAVLQHVRELFVRINTTGRQVSGHFIILLNDKSLSAMAVRSFCEQAKNVKTDSASMLNLIEWNMRENAVARKVNREYSLTSIGIIADVLSDFAFHESNGYPTTLLRLKAFKDELEERYEAHKISVETISENNFDITQIKTLKNLIDENIGKPLVILFSKPEPFVKRTTAFFAALKKLNSEVAEGVRGSSSFHNLLTYEYREWHKTDNPDAHDAQSRFTDHVENALHDSEYEYIYFSNVFQQGMIRVWIKLCRGLSLYELSNLECAEIVVCLLSPIAFSSKLKAFSYEKSFNRLTIYKERTQRLLVNSKSREAWTLLMLSMTKNSEAISLLEKLLRKKNYNKEKCQAVFDFVTQTAEKAHQDINKQIRDKTHEYYKKYWETLNEVLPAEQFQMLATYKQDADKGDEDASIEFDKTIEEYAKSSIEKAQMDLKDLIGV